MGFYLRKSVRVGPLRFNLSGSGIGVSCGIPGLRIGTGPRGNYINAGRGGIYYRAAFPKKHPPRAASVFHECPASEIPPNLGTQLPLCALLHESHVATLKSLSA